MKKKFGIAIAFVVALLLVGCGANEDEPAAEGYDLLGGGWTVGGIYWEETSIFRRGDLIDVHDVDGLEDYYKENLVLKQDGSFTYHHIWHFVGDYTKSAAGDESYFLTPTSTLTFENGELVEKEYSGTMKWIVTLIDENTLACAEYGSITGKAKANEYPLVFVKEDTFSSYIDANKITIEMNDNNSSTTNSSTNVANTATELLSSYQGILNAYTQKMKNAVPGLISEYKAAASGESDVERLAEICNDKIGELAEIFN